MTSGLREAKKQRTRLALVDAALELFLAHGYEQTTIDEIAAAVEVSQRTFFRYFATKEDAVTGLLVEYDSRLVERVRSRPDEERVVEALLAAMRGLLRDLADSDAVQLERMRRLRQVMETNPGLVAAYLTRYSRVSTLLSAELARRMCLDPETDLRPRLLASIYLAAVRVGFEDCACRAVFEPKDVVRRVAESVTLALHGLRDDWTCASDGTTLPRP